MRSRNDTHVRIFLTFLALVSSAILISSCAAVLGAIEDRLPPPSEVEEGILLRFNAPSAREVTLAGSFNNWGGTETGRYDPRIDPMGDPDGDGVWTIVKPLPPGRYEYKFVLDGAVRWEADPTNPETVDDNYGGVNSVLVVPPTVDYEYEVVTGTVTSAGSTKSATPKKEQRAATVAISIDVDFPDASEVYLAGTFNDWDPSVVPLAKGDDGVWRASIDLEPGEYLYKFVVDGTWVEDPGNPESVDDGYGGTNSVLTVE